MIKEIKLTSRRLSLLESTGIFSLEDLLEFYPKKYEDLKITLLTKEKDNQRVVCVGKIDSEIVIRRIRNNLTRMQFIVQVDNKPYTITIFNREYLLNTLTQGKYVKITGKLDYYHQSILASNIYYDLDSTVLTSYKLAKGLKEGEFKKLIKEALDHVKYENLDKLPFSLIKKYRLDSKNDSIKMVHFPSSIEEVKRGYRHLKYEELLEFVTILELNKRSVKTDVLQGCKTIDYQVVKSFVENMSFELTKSQELAIKEIIEDLEKPMIMYRLLQGDVGSGKTLVSIIAMIANATSNKQSAMMAPTDLLARQHLYNIKKLLEKTDLKVKLLVSDMSSIEKKALKEELKLGEVNIVVGTHALIQKDVEFKDLGLVIIDEQHRFGVRQRQELKNKGEKVDLLLMSATPIPRTLAHTIYGDLDISTIDEFPLGKRKVKTFFVKDKNISKFSDEIEELIKKRNKIYVVCPLIDSDNKSKNSVLKVFEQYKNKYGDYGVGYLHGKMSDQEKIQVLDEFNMGKINVLVSTTVIEVGIDVKDAKAIIIYGANNFGLAQIHQLRGRVGRNGELGFCYLLSDNDDEEANERLEFLCNEDDGFKISEYDMQKRGGGDIIGTKQSGVSDLKLANIIDDYHILEIARKDCKEIFANQENFDNKRYLDYVKSKLNKNIEVIG